MRVVVVVGPEMSISQCLSVVECANSNCTKVKALSIWKREREKKIESCSIQSKYKSTRAGAAK